jgi:putative tryptophan/tyrosine transport system substrate-binding protein
MRRIGVLINRPADDRESQAGVEAFQQVLQQLGWTDGRGSTSVGRERCRPLSQIRGGIGRARAGRHLGQRHPERGGVAACHPFRAIVFVSVVDPVGAGLVDTLARPGGNTTGFMLFEYSLSGKWLELLKQIAPRLTRVAVLRNLANASGLAEFGAIQAVAQQLGVEVSGHCARRR